MSACDGNDTAGCIGCGACNETRHRSTPPTARGHRPNYADPEVLAEAHRREAQLRLIPADQRWNQTITPEPEY